MELLCEPTDTLELPPFLTEALLELINHPQIIPLLEFAFGKDNPIWYTNGLEFRNSREYWAVYYNPETNLIEMDRGIYGYSDPKSRSGTGISYDEEASGSLPFDFEICLKNARYLLTDNWVKDNI